MLKIRVTFIDDPNGNKELEQLKEDIENNYKILNESKVYKGRGKSLYSSIYLDIEKWTILV